MVSTHLEAAEQTFEPLKTHPELATIAAELLWRAGQLDSRAEFLSQALPLLQQATGADFAALVSSEGGHWTAVAKTGVGRPLPIGLLADVLDRESAAAEAPLGRGSAGAPCRQRRAAAVARSARPTERRFAAHDRSPGARVRQRARAVRRRSRSMPGSSGWKRFWKSPANGARPTRWSRCSNRWPKPPRGCCAADRASIFLWDRPNRMLVGRPALGVDGGELRIPDDSGVVGQVVAHRASRGASAASTTRRRSIARSIVSSAIKPARCSACRCAAARASCSAPSK